jgi:hypothetical protein
MILSIHMTKTTSYIMRYEVRYQLRQQVAVPLQNHAIHQLGVQVNINVRGQLYDHLLK